MGTHHVFHGTANRKKAEEFGLKIPVCDDCHRRIHADRELDLSLKMEWQGVFEQTHSREEFRRHFGRSYL